MSFSRFILLACFAFFIPEKGRSQTLDSTVLSQKIRRATTTKTDSLLPKTEAKQVDSTAFSIKPVEKGSLAPVDSMAKKGSSRIVGFFKNDYPNPRKALLFSIIVPGGGQFYNKKYWKVPLAWAAIGATGYFMFSTRKTYRSWQRNYLAFVDQDSTTFVQSLPINPKKPDGTKFTELDQTSLKQGRDYYRNWLEKSYVFVGAAYLLAATDAFVDAHLATFDVSDDLSFRIRPSQILTARGPDAVGLSFTFSLKNDRK